MSLLRPMAFVFLLAAAHVPAVLAQATRSPAPDLDALVKAAKSEGELMVYGSMTDNVLRRVNNAYAAAYGMKTAFVRLSSSPLLQRFAAEAAAGSFAADVVLAAGGAHPFAVDAIKKGWVEPIGDAGIPVLKSGQYPAAFNRGATAIAAILLWSISYNSEKVRGADIPRTWEDLLHPKWKGQILISDPASTEANLDVWALVQDKYGEGFFNRLRAQQPRVYQSQVPMIQALGAGEGSIGVPTNDSAVQMLVAKGSPIGTVPPTVTTGVEMQIFLTARGKAKHPNAARLYAQFVLSPEGSKIFNDDPGSYSPYDTTRLPKGYESPKPNVVARKNQINKALGIQ